MFLNCIFSSNHATLVFKSRPSASTMVTMMLHGITNTKVTRKIFQNAGISESLHLEWFFFTYHTLYNRWTLWPSLNGLVIFGAKQCNKVTDKWWAESIYLVEPGKCYVISLISQYLLLNHVVNLVYFNGRNFRGNFFALINFSGCDFCFLLLLSILLTMFLYKIMSPI